MEDVKPIINRVAESGLITIDLESLYPSGERILFDIQPLLFKGMILKESEFRDFVKQHDWSAYTDKFIAFHCSTDAIVPTWAYMLLGIAVEPFAKRYVFGNLQKLEEILFHEALQKINPSDFANQRVIIKGCSDIEVPVSAYLEITHLLQPYVKSMMYGEACSNVPLWKKRD